MRRVGCAGGDAAAFARHADGFTALMGAAWCGGAGLLGRLLRLGAGPLARTTAASEADRKGALDLAHERAAHPEGPRRHHAEMALMNELWFAVVPQLSSPASFLMWLPKAPTNLSAAKALDLSGRLVEDLRQVSLTTMHVCAAAWNSPLENGVDRKGATSPNELSKRSLAENTEAMRRWSARGGGYRRVARGPLERNTQSHGQVVCCAQLRPGASFPRGSAAAILLSHFCGA